MYAMVFIATINVLLTIGHSWYALHCEVMHDVFIGFHAVGIYVMPLGWHLCTMDMRALCDVIDNSI